MNSSLPKKFKINEHLTLKLEDNRTNIYVHGELFRQCSFLLLNIPVEDIPKFDNIQSIDEVAELLDKSLEGEGRYNLDIDPSTEFWGHCSNLQVWYEHDYDTRLLHSNLAFPLLKKLADAGDMLAKAKFREEIARRFLSGNFNTIYSLLQERYLKILAPEEIAVIEENFTYSTISTYPKEYIMILIMNFAELGFRKIPLEILKEHYSNLFTKGSRIREPIFSDSTLKAILSIDSRLGKNIIMDTFKFLLKEGRDKKFIHKLSDPKIRHAFTEKLQEQISMGDISILSFLLRGGYEKIFTKDEREFIFQDVDFTPFFSISSCLKFRHLYTLANYGVKDAHKMVKRAIVEALNSKDRAGISDIFEHSYGNQLNEKEWSDILDDLDLLKILRWKVFTNKQVFELIHSGEDYFRIYLRKRVSRYIYEINPTFLTKIIILHYLELFSEMELNRIVDY
ncbi:MAG: hypothetical protein EU549_03150, partial [Promethearchaeota archaeon]